MLVVKYYEYDTKDGIYKIRCETFNACYPINDDSMIFEKDNDAVVINLRRIISIGFIRREC